MRGRSFGLILGALIVLLVIGGISYFYYSTLQADAPTTQTQDQTDAEALTSEANELDEFSETLSSDAAAIDDAVTSDQDEAASDI